MPHDFIFKGGASKRFHTCRTIKEQDIAAHSFGVAWFCELITGGQASKGLIMAALTHDLAEHHVGDMPAPAKRGLGIKDMFDKFEHEKLVAAGLGDYMCLVPSERAVLNAADALDGMKFCLSERALGNRCLDHVFRNFTEYVAGACTSLEALGFQSYCARASELINDITSEWKEYDYVSK